MLRLFNTLGNKIEPFSPVNSDTVTVFTCGPSVYQRSHIGNLRTFLFEDTLVRYLEYSSYTVKRGMNLTDIEDKAIQEAEKRKKGVKELTGENIGAFIRDMKLLGMKAPDYLLRASDAVERAVEIIEQLMKQGVAYRHGLNCYFDPLKYPEFGQLYGLDMKRWPKKKRRFHKDTYPGMRWNLGDFILWHGYRDGDPVYWETRIGKGRPAWNIQDPSMIIQHFEETLSVYCGGIDNLIRHHDYSRAILESIRPFPMAKFWLHCHHLYAEGRKMSKSTGNMHYTDTLVEKGYTAQEIRFFLIYGHYRKRLNYTDENMGNAAERLRAFRDMIRRIQSVRAQSDQNTDEASQAQEIKAPFVSHMDNDLNVKAAFDALYTYLSAQDAAMLTPQAASNILFALEGIDGVLQVIF